MALILVYLFAAFVLGYVAMDVVRTYRREKALRAKPDDVAERQEVVAILRRLCAEPGDNDWPDNLHLSDVIEKHLIRPMLSK